MKMPHVLAGAGVHRSAVLSSCGTYRYTLLRIWNCAKPRVVWVMLNPSTADALQDDPTIRKCASFADLWGFGAIEVVNAFGYRATDPRDLHNAVRGPRNSDIVGRDNDYGVLGISGLIPALDRAGKIVVAWGAHLAVFPNRRRQLTQILQGRRIECLGVTQDKHPKHPLYVPLATPLIPWLGATPADPETTYKTKRAE